MSIDINNPTPWTGGWATGPTGADGATWATGPTGADGSDGATWATGPTGGGSSWMYAIGLYEVAWQAPSGDLVTFTLPVDATIDEIQVKATSAPTDANYVIYAKKNFGATDTISGTFEIATTDTTTNGIIQVTHASFTGQITTKGESLTFWSSSACTLFPFNVEFTVKYTPS